MVTEFTDKGEAGQIIPWGGPEPENPPEGQPVYNVMAEYYESSMEEGLDYIKFINSENKVFQGIRETHQDDLEIIELIREILFENVKLIEFLRGKIENDRRENKELSRLSR